MTRGRIAFAAALLAIFGAGGLFVSAFTVPMYSGGGTLYGENGADILFGISVPVVLAIVAFAGLAAKCTSGSVLGNRVATTALAVLALFTVVTGFSIGILVAPIAALVALAVAATPWGALNDVLDDVE